jgi:hypothetical protein
MGGILTSALRQLGKAQEKQVEALGVPRVTVNVARAKALNASA